jgi:hypothetical protein
MKTVAWLGVLTFLVGAGCGALALPKHHLRRVSLVIGREP